MQKLRFEVFLQRATQEIHELNKKRIEKYEMFCTAASD